MLKELRYGTVILWLISRDSAALIRFLEKSPAT
jgi:hypothetical protein